MDYEHLYSYLESRPLKEQKACMQRIVQLVIRQCNDGENLQLQLGNGEARSVSESMTTRRQQISEQFWTQEAVWCKFGDSNIEHMSFNALTLATAPLFMKSTVAQYLIARNALIDDEVAQKKNKDTPSCNDATTARMKPPQPTVPAAVHPNKHHTPQENTRTLADNDKPEVHVEQSGDVSRLSKRGRDGNRFDDKDLKAPYYHKPCQPSATHKCTDKSASQPRPISCVSDSNHKAEKDLQSTKKPRRANFFD